MATFNLTDQTELFKINYYKKSENMYNSENVLQGRIRKKYDFTGKEKLVATPFSFSGGVGAKLLPQANAGSYGNAIIQSKKVYARVEIEREAIKASANDKGAFVRATRESVQKGVESYMRNASRILFGDGTGVLASGDGAATNVTGAGSVADPYIVTFAEAEFQEAVFEEKDFHQMVVAGTAEGGDTVANLLEVVEVLPSSFQVKYVGTSARLAALTGVGPIIATDQFVMQRSFNAEPTGLELLKKQAIDGSGTLYNIAFQRRWSMQVEQAAGKGVTTDLMNKVMLDVEKRFGRVPKMIMTSYEQFRNILALMEDHKRYALPNRNLKGSMSFEGVEFMSTRGPVGIFVDRFCKKDDIWFLNEDYIECHHRPGFGWFDDDGTVFLRKADDDEYEARYGGYYENYITPTAHGCLTGLAV